MKPYGLSYSVTGCTCGLCRPGDTVKIMPTVVYCVPINIAHVRQQNVTLKTLFLNRQNHSLIKVKLW